MAELSYNEEISTGSEGEGERGLVRTRVVTRLRGMITEGMFLPGDKLVERELCTQLSASRPSVREALRQLEAERLVEIAPYRGPRVRSLTEREFLEVWEIWHTLNCLAVKRFVRSASEQDLAEVSHWIEALCDALTARDSNDIRINKHMFYLALTRGTQSAPLLEYIEQLNARLGFLWSSSLAVPGRPKEGIVELRQLLSALTERSAEAADSAMRLHLHHAFSVAKVIFANLRSSPPA